MADFGYSGAPRTTDPVALVRLMIGDTDAADPLLTDSEIGALVSLQPVPSYAAAAAADCIAAKFTRQVDKSIGATSIQASQRAEAYRELADRLRAGGAGSLPGGDGTGVPTASFRVGGLSISEKNAARENTDAIQPSFEVGKDDHPGVPNEINPQGRW